MASKRQISTTVSPLAKNHVGALRKFHKTAPCHRRDRGCALFFLKAVKERGIRIGSDLIALHAVSKLFTRHGLVFQQECHNLVEFVGIVFQNLLTKK